MAIIALIAGGCFLLQELRAQDAFDYAKPYAGELEFNGNYVIDGDGLRGFARLADGTVVYAKYQLESPEEKAAMEESLYKSKLYITGVFEKPSPPSHEFSFDMQKYLNHNGSRYILAIQTVKGVEAAPTMLSKLYERRKWLKRHIQASFPPALAAEAEALLIGEQENMTNEDRLMYQTLGITHLFAISGLHVAIIVGIGYFILVRLHIRKETALLLLLAILPMYGVLAGGAPSVLRSICMVSAVMVFRLFRIRLSIAHILLASFAMFILWDPYIMYDIGFQLSYGASFGIIYSTRFLSGEGSAVKNGLIITAISQLTLYPLLLHHFYEISLSAFLVNSLFVPLYTLFILPVNLVLLGLTFLFQPAADFVFYFYVPVRGFIETVMHWLSGLPYQMWNPGKPGPLMMLALFTSVMAFYSLAERGFRLRQLLVLLAPAICFSALPYFDPALKVTFLDVGQGDSAVIELPYRRGVYLIDSGGLLRFDTEAFKKRNKPYEVGRQVVAPYLKGNGISTIDILVLSHADADHAEGAEELFPLFRVNELHLSPGSAATDIMQALAPFAGEAPVLFPGKGAGWKESGVSFSYLSPSDAEYEGNNDSLVLLVESGDFRVLFTGDLETAGEQDLLETFGTSLTALSVLKVGHHGSKTSSSKEFLSLVQPEVSIFSTGIDNRYGHPSEEVVERFDELGLPTLNTAETGTIKFQFQDGDVKFQTMR
ncbi:DNA internalization-related competence protein ComEC/Rec2 [Planococcus shenhongbingii]|uniref:DNA internalization-related competence protein ComEC/Rec2 n=1 Tax=Planococcus shenhongbingii TaxID=3058398 RepID=UPI002605C85B|nr:DNA internalization-related competence protein ComEC/Rec2 [Planococcus sp. N016]WKA60070.1 DNA internalization-related competence protein ComEC/Rec2 [Planococcus sp. N016]